MDCIFCKIISGATPCHKIYEDETVLAFLDIFPHAKGHTVVVPKQHYANLSDLTSADWQALTRGLKQVYKRIMEVLKPDGMNIGINDGQAAGQVVPHVHWHIMPRWQGDGGGSTHSMVKNPGDLSVEEVAKMFSS